MYAVAEMLVVNPGNHLCCHFDAELHRETLDTLFFAFGGSRSQTINHILRDVDAGDILVHVFSHTGGLQRDDAGHNVRLDPGAIDQIEEPLEGIEIEDAPRLNVHCTGLDLLTQFVDLNFNRVIVGGHGSTLTSTHYVRVEFLEEVVLGEIRRLTKFASLYEDEFVKAVIGHSQQAEQTDRKLKEKELKTLLARDDELDGLFERIYEDNVSGKLSNDRFAKMSRRYEDEQKELAEKIKKLRSEIEKQSSRSMTTDMFIGLVRKYTRARKLTPRMLNELIEKIEVFNAEKIDGVWEQRLRIHYNCVGTIEIPTVLPLPIPEVSVNTRKGVVVNYAPCELAV